MYFSPHSLICTEEPSVVEWVGGGGGGRTSKFHGLVAESLLGRLTLAPDKCNLVSVGRTETRAVVSRGGKGWLKVATISL